MWTRFQPRDYFLIWLALTLMGLWLRPLTPIDETRAVSVAYEMWLRGDFLVPHLNGEPYSHKPPLLQWCINLLWLIFGVQEWCARLVAPLFALGNLALTAALARRLWPEDEAVRRLAPLFLLAMPVWALWTSLTLYDMPVTFFTLLGLLGIARAAQGEGRAGWALAGLAIGGGILAKGPVILLLILPPALAAPWWLKSRPERGWGGWWQGMGVAILLGALIGLAWAMPAGFVGGEEYRRLIFWGQSAGRIANSFAHRRPFWWYLELLPILWFPWFWWPPLWRAARAAALDAGMRFCAAHGLFVILLFSLVSGKQIHYLLPLYPSLALFSARALSRSGAAISRFDQAMIGLLVGGGAAAFLLAPMLGQPIGRSEAAYIAENAPLAAKLALLGLGLALLAWRPANVWAGARGLALAMLGLMFAAHLVYRQIGWQFYDMHPFARHLRAAQKQGAPIAYWGKYNGEFNFLARLQRPLLEFDDRQAFRAWLRAHPDAYVVCLHKPEFADLDAGAEFVQHYRGTRRVALWRGAEMLADQTRLERLLN
jgi:4-amino-4-deoxy-L-arabinose transferase-like glycosyltransferase